ncbi:MAG: exonuclease domain-containing protein [Patescibacteria group bacterium]
MNSLKYCSLDIETSGFDPVKDEILEIGFVFFTLDEKGIKLEKEYSKVFRPQKEVSETILALTGITKKELESAESFEQHREGIQEKLQDVCLVGHNIGFDIKFLQGLGLKLEGPNIDTLDLAQFILPTHPSYNLENLMHYFGVPHTEAHRALADAKAALRVLEGLLKIFAGFPLKLKKEVLNILKPSGFVFKELLDIRAKGSGRKPQATEVKANFSEYPLEFKGNIFYNFSLGVDILTLVVKSLETAKNKTLLVVPNIQLAFGLLRENKCEPAYASEQLFNEEAFEAFKHKQPLNSDEIKFIIKILVWQYTNWQTKNISDINLSFFGGQFRHHIAGQKPEENKISKFIVCDLEAFFAFKQKGWYKNRKAVFLGLGDLEKALEGSLGQKLSWSNINFLLKRIYNPDTGAGDENLKSIVEEGLLAGDLFFGLVSALLQTNPPGFFQKKLEEIEPNILAKIQSASESFSAKLEAVNILVESPEISAYRQNLGKFFIKEDNYVRWLELSPKSCVFNSSPINIQDLSAEIFKFNRETVFCDCLPRLQVWEYFQKRLGLKDFKMQFVELGKTKPKDLFSYLGIKPRGFRLEARPGNLSDPELLKFCEKNSLPAAILLPSALKVKSFYQQYHETLKKSAFVLAQNGSAGNSRILRNFTIHENSLLLTSDKFILKSLLGKGAGIALGNLPVKTLVLNRLPFEQFTHPYFEAVSKQFENPFEDFSLPRALMSLHFVVKFFYSPKLENLFIFDSKLNKPYARVFLEYLKQIVDK